MSIQQLSAPHSGLMSYATRRLIDACHVQNYSSAPSESAQPNCVAVVKKPGRMTRTLTLWQQRSQQRRELSELLNHPELLRDIGLSVYDVRREQRKPFWRE